VIGPPYHYCTIPSHCYCSRRPIYTVSQKNCASIIFWIPPWNIGQL